MSDPERRPVELAGTEAGANRTLVLAQERKRRAQAADPRAYAIARAMARLIFGLCVGAEVSGLDRVPRTGPVLIVANHLSFLEPPLLTAILPRRITYLALYDLFAIPWLAPVLRLLGALPIKRGGARDLDAIRAALELLEHGAAVGLFPEGTRSLQPGLLRGNPGISLLALRSGAPVLPVAVTGTEQLTSIWAFLTARPRRVRVRVVVGHPFLPTVNTSRVDHQAVTDQIMGELAALLPPAYQGAYRVREA